MKKHSMVHEGSARHCNYFNNDKRCPYESIGCMFQHERFGKCPKTKCHEKLRQFEHENDVQDGQTYLIVTSKLTVDEHDFTEDEVECQNCGCGCTFVDETELNWHMKQIIQNELVVCNKSIVAGLVTVLPLITN